MSPVYVNPRPSSPIPFLDQFKGDVAAATSFSYLDKSHNNASDHERLAIDYSWHPQDKVERVLSHDKPNDSGKVFQSSSWPQNYTGEGSRGCNYAHQTSNHCGENKIKIVTNNEQKQSRRWKPSKVRIMQKMMTTSKNIGDHKLQHNLEQQRNQSNTYRNNNTNNNNNGIRICADCHTTTTPLWRSGPQGPKSLCNACGIRQRKARRAAMAAAEIAKEGIASSSSSLSGESLKPQVYEQEEREIRQSDHHENHPLPLKKRGKIAFHHQDAIPQRAFPRDEEEGAILLMALSCGLACSS